MEASTAFSSHQKFSHLLSDGTPHPRQYSAFRGQNGSTNYFWHGPVNIIVADYKNSNADHCTEFLDVIMVP